MKRRRWSLQTDRKQSRSVRNSSYFEGSTSGRFGSRERYIEDEVRNSEQVHTHTAVVDDIAPLQHVQAPEGEHIENYEYPNDESQGHIGGTDLAPTDVQGRDVQAEAGIGGDRSAVVSRDGCIFDISYPKLYSLIMLSGSKRMSHSVYSETCNHLNYMARSARVPRFPALTKAKELCGEAEEELFVKHSYKMYSVDFNKTQSKGGRGKMLSNTHAPAIVVYPSDWAKFDFQSTSFSELLTASDRAANCMPFCNIDDVPMAKDRANILSSTSIPNMDGSYVAMVDGLPVQCCIEPSQLESHEGVVLEVFDVVTKNECSVTLQCTIGEATVINKESKSRLQTLFCDGTVVAPIRSREESSVTSDVRGNDINSWLVFRTSMDGYRQSILLRSDADEVNDAHVEIVVSDVCARKDRVDYSPQMCNGVLPNGEKYVLYRFILYADGFTPYRGKFGSYTGVYMMNMNIPPDLRSVHGCIHHVSLTPPGVSGNSVIQDIMKDINSGSTEGFLVQDNLCNTYRMFFDFMGFIGDTPAITETTDLRGHNGIAPCTYCTFQRRETHGANGSRYAYTCAISSKSPAFRRSNTVSTHLRNMFSGDDKALQVYGMSLCFNELGNPWSRYKCNVRTNRRDHHRHTLPFDRYLSLIVAPDHLFERLCEHVMIPIIRCMSTTQRGICNKLLSLYFPRASFQNSGDVINVTKACLNPMSTSERNNVFFLLPDVTRNVLVYDNRFQDTEAGHEKRAALVECIDLQRTLCECMSRVYFFPKEARDGVAVVERFCNEHGQEWMRETVCMLENYIKAAHSACVNHPCLREDLDKPSIHRLLEFAHRTLPSFGHVRFINELIFERAHQEMKGGIIQSNHMNPQLQAMRDAIADSWIQMLASATSKITAGGDGWDESSTRLVLRLSGSSEWSGNITMEQVNHIRSTFNEPMLQSLREREHQILPQTSTSDGLIWERRGPTFSEEEIVGSLPACDVRDYLQRCCTLEKVEAYMKEVYQCQQIKTNGFQRVVLVQTRLGVVSKKSVKCNLECGQFLQCTYQECPRFSSSALKIMDKRVGIKSRPMLYVYLFTVSVRHGRDGDEVLFAVCTGTLPGQVTGSFKSDYPIFIIRLDGDVKPCFDVHMCDANCVSKEHAPGEKCVHVLQHGIYCVRGSLEGYPPYHG